MLVRSPGTLIADRNVRAPGKIFAPLRFSFKCWPRMLHQINQFQNQTAGTMNHTQDKIPFVSFAI